MTVWRGGMRGTPAVVALALTVLTASCAPRRVVLPQDPGVAMADAASVYADAAASCRGIRTFTAELRLSGRAGDARVSGRVIAGFDRSGSMRLEGLAPFGPAAFILAARTGAAVLLLPRDQRVVRGADAESVLDALSGVRLAPADLLAALTGCVVPNGTVRAGRLHSNGWASIDLADGATMYLRRVGGRWEARAGRRPSWEIEYDLWQGGLPRAVRLRSSGVASPVTLDVAISQIEANGELRESAFTLDVPAGVEEMTLEELRQAGPLRGR